MGLRIELTDDEALVLFEWLARRSAAQAPDHVATAEDVALWGLEGLLDKQLVTTFAADYHDQLEAARARLLAE